MTSRAQKIRDQIKHPIIDGDGHWVESFPVLLDYLRENDFRTFIVSGGALPSCDR